MANFGDVRMIRHELPDFLQGGVKKSPCRTFKDLRASRGADRGEIEKPAFKLASGVFVLMVPLVFHLRGPQVFCKT
jgi:hypothetical protein